MFAGKTDDYEVFNAQVLLLVGVRARTGNGNDGTCH